MLLFFPDIPADTTDGRSSFNTSHVVVFLIVADDTTEGIPCFNTSHVVVFLKYVYGDEVADWVSIHLMLLFFKAETM